MNSCTIPKGRAGDVVWSRVLLVASRGHFADNGCDSVAFRAARVLVGVPRSVFRYSNCVPVASHAAGVKMETVKVGKVMRSEKGKDLAIKGFKFRF